ncbi:MULTISPECIES: transcriptional regulator GcvA [unclassified Variovorax]|uniref:transcriptional regulator GcvA n=1 Tax=unclassified Variovorax TaxID=663243 RepID=UPI00076C06A8|nr:MULTISPECIES: transcriptional regulator GcvA [unclassified Variovorax]KWT92079.1 Glycine cleavage system transcriptional activator [Variovorax sp. WDL1]PNG47018.1 Glycine cleavage system transcriptional activator [Variovorax sp. B2]PNG48331.1 Glycine cleavage system transcriptional activator [Variovorax sp. B4]VTV14871.1 Gcv operon activator [Variovorax sp. WDL1]
MDPLPPLNPLKCFEATGRLLSVSNAATELFVTPAAVSRQIKTLEQFLGVKLFKRIPGGLELTVAGARFLSDVTPLFSALREATNVVMGGGFRRHSLKLRSPATFAVKWLIPRLASFHREHPDIDVQLSTSPAPLRFDREDIDAGIELGDGQWPRTKAQRLVANELVPVTSARNAAGSKPLRTPEDLEGETLLHSMARPDDWQLWLQACDAPHVNGYRGMKYETSLLAYQAAAEGHGVAIAQKAIVERELATGVLMAPFDFVLDRKSHTYYFVWPDDRAESKALTAFKRWLSEVV